MDRNAPTRDFGSTREKPANSTVIALIDIFGRMTPVEFEPRQLSPAA